MHCVVLIIVEANYIILEYYYYLNISISFHFDIHDANTNIGSIAKEDPGQQREVDRVRDLIGMVGGDY